ncbi:MAG: hypothetical protein GX131_17035 [candidate division WS1 bacterium]|jgi:uncharacterized spore protein YtfJ|nr:hypothetical protein [candidate division WS1 bacterium]
MMADFDIGSFMKDVVSGMATLNESVNVIGQPVEVAGKVIIPAVVTRMCFGAGGGGGSTPSDEDSSQRDTGSGGGGGGGVTLTPVFLVVDDEGERLLTISSPIEQACSMVDKAKSTLDRVMPRKKEAKPSEIEVEEHFGDDRPSGAGPAH